MYAETGLLYPYFQSFSQDVQHLEEFCGIQKTNASSMGNLLSTTTLLEYDMGAEGDLFKAPEPIIAEPLMGLDPMSETISMISSGNDDISSQTIKVVDMETIQSEHMLSEVIYECRKDLMAKSAIGESFAEDLAAKFPVVQMEEDPIAEMDRLISEVSIQKSKSVSSGCLSSMEWIHRDVMRPNFSDFHGVAFGAAYGMRRAFSEGDIQTLNTGKTNHMHSPFERTLTIGNYNIEDRMQKLSRYRTKKAKRNFGRTIKYACRKALADNQPRVRGRFAKTEESDTQKKTFSKRMGGCILEERQ
ncbi:CCT domain [Macleaya cordata]|uniref:CCT domain n=1 Tax=Macleaya cordata TaxID=56857 RepID=A0A200QW51_MACCD|nr:CCT domain [Macleaya cordata]